MILIQYKRVSCTISEQAVQGVQKNIQLVSIY